ncbi:hypothetical protein Nepgr_004485 [Nepenthes gracilis]|uniref:Uncharacterized protein n=1 Tax=Nepenthes gracilis TaxID=150966 RepID=A0AAD3S1Y2_NEPGR|nr:hypothetical protein Nepgr_004485 [Nepenthes gracilis]
MERRRWEYSESHDNKGRINEASVSSKSTMKMKKNMQRLGGRGLSLAAFANSKTRSNSYNPALLKKRREFYKNAKYVSKYKKQKRQGELIDLSPAIKPNEGQNESGSVCNENKKKGKGCYSLEKVYSKKREEVEKERSEREAIIKAKKEERERAEVQRKASREKMFKKTRKDAVPHDPRQGAILEKPADLGF